MKRIANKIFSRLTMGALMILLQFGWIVFLIYSAMPQSTAINVGFQVLAVALALYVANKDIRTSYKMSWIFLILFLPVFGCPAYFLFGKSGLTKRTKKRYEKYMETVRVLREENTDVEQELEREDFYACQQAHYLLEYAGYPLYPETDSRYYSSGEAAFPDLLADLESAEKYIFMEYFIVEEGQMFDAIVSILQKKAEEGLDVRLIYDDVGSIQTLPPHYERVLEKKGIKCVSFNPFRPVLSVVMNHRDHRKITVVDGKVAYTGGFNLADEYINVKEKYGYWKDAGLRLTGEAVWSFVTMFLEMWGCMTGKEEDDYEAYRFKTPSAPVTKAFIQPYADSPLDNEYVGENVYLNLLNHAKKYVYIFSPYLIIGSEVRTALINAAKCGVDVRIVVPGIADKKLVYLLTQANFAQLIKGGVRIYKYTPGFIHSKCFVVDDFYATVGTINLDYRSLFLHFECGVSMYNTKTVMQVKEDTLETFEKSHEVTLDECQSRLLFVRMFMGALKLFAPLL